MITLRKAKLQKVCIKGLKLCKNNIHMDRDLNET